MNILAFVNKHKITLVFAILALGAITLSISNRINDQTAVENTENIPTVSTVAAGNYQKQKTIDIGNGTVESLGQADLKSQISSPITQINVKLGDHVSAGQTLVQLQNNDIRAQLDQAKAALALAQSKLEETKRGSRAEEINISQTTADETQLALINSIKDSYSKSDDAIHNHIDKFFVNPREKSAEFKVEINTSGANQITFEPSDTELAAQIENQKYDLEKMLDSWLVDLNGLQTSSDTAQIEKSLALSKKNLQLEIDFLNAMAPLVNSLSTDSTAYKGIIDGYKTEFSAARSTVSGALTSLQGAQTNWRGANEALNLKLAGSSSEQIKQNQASVDQAQASVAALQATLAKTSIVSPIAGEVSYIFGNIGEFITAGTLVASVVNPDTLQIKAYVSENDLQSIFVNDPVAIGENAAGLVQTISPAVDQQTKKAEIDIIVTKNGQPAIVVGQTASIKISSAKLVNGNETYLLPIEMIQFSGNGNYVFTVENGAVKRIPVTTGEIVGENVYVTGGLTPKLEILPSVRGFEEGEIVKIQE